MSILLKKYYFRYPQYLWAKEIFKFIKEYNLDKKLYFFDAPCGDGVISFWLSSWIKNGKFKLLDISEKSIKMAKQKNERLDIQIGNVFEYENTSKQKYTWLFINSLFCLKNGENLIDRYKDDAKNIICIFPDIKHKNYKCHYEKYGFENPTPLNDDDTISAFQNFGYSLKKKKKITFIPYHCYDFKGQNIFFNILDKFLGRKNGAYYICLFSKED